MLYGFHYLLIISANTNAVTTNAIATTDVHLPNIASIVLDLFLPKNVSAPPAIVPDKPAVFPDCSRTTAISITEKIICKTVKAILSNRYTSKHI